MTQVFGFHRGPKRKVPSTYAPRSVPLNVPSNQNLPEGIGTHPLTVHRDAFPTYVDRMRTGERRGERPFLDEDRVPRVEQQPGDAIPSANFRQPPRK